MQALILAGGASRRMGRPKALLKLNGEPFVLGLIRALRGVGLQVYVLGGAHGPQIAQLLPSGVQLIQAQAWRAGMRASLRAALQRMPEGPLLLTHVDRPRVASATLQALSAAPERCPWIPTWQEQPGHPVRLPAWLRPRILWRDELPLREILYRAGARRLPVSDPDILLNINDVRSLKALKEQERRAP